MSQTIFGEVNYSFFPLTNNTSVNELANGGGFQSTYNCTTCSANGIIVFLLPIHSFQQRPHTSGARNYENHRLVGKMRNGLENDDSIVICKLPRHNREPRWIQRGWEDPII